MSDEVYDQDNPAPEQIARNEFIGGAYLTFIRDQVEGFLATDGKVSISFDVEESRRLRGAWIQFAFDYPGAQDMFDSILESWQ